VIFNCQKSLDKWTPDSKVSASSLNNQRHLGVFILEHYMKMNKTYASWLAAIAMLGGGALTAHAAEWISLFDGKTLTGWVQRGGEAKYRVEDGQIIGTTVPKTPNSFLCTDKTYGDFILELEFKVDPKMNSGIQFRSNVFGEDTTLDDVKNAQGKPIKIAAGRVHGYQCEIDPSARAWTAGIYDEGRRGWLNDLKDNPKAQKAFKQNEWNKVRIEAIGDSLKTYLNGVPAADLKDSLTPEGFISLQVHGIGNKTETMEVAWRNIRIQDLDAAKRTKIFNGKNLEGWTLADGKPVTAGWQVEDGVLYRAAKGGDIYTAKEYGDFDFRFEWKVAEGSNSGVKYRMAQYGKSWLGPEYQVLDDEKHPDAKLREGRRKSGGLYDLYVPNSSKILKPVGEWNCSRIVAKGSKIEHWLNGALVVSYDTASDDFKERVMGSKFAKTPTFNQNASGRIQLQDHGDPVWYRNLTVQ